MAHVLLYATAVASAPYVFDAAWAPQFPAGSGSLSGVDVVQTGAGDTLVYVTQRGNLTLPPVIILSPRTGAVVSSWGLDHGQVAFTKDGWGAHGIKVERLRSVVSAGDPIDPNIRVWIDDFTRHTLTAFSATGKKLLELGTPGVAGNGTHPLQFGNLADMAIDSAAGKLYVSDGDGGSANRVVSVTITPPSSTNATFTWATKAGRYDNPHSIALHKRSGLLFLANREANETRLIRAADGVDLGVFDCGVHFGPGAGVGEKPFGVRTLSFGASLDLGFVAMMDNPQDGRNQHVAVLDFSGLSAASGASSSCAVVQTLDVDASKFSGPHLLGVDEKSGDVSIFYCVRLFALGLLGRYRSTQTYYRYYISCESFSQFDSLLRTSSAPHIRCTRRSSATRRSPQSFASSALGASSSSYYGED